MPFFRGNQWLELKSIRKATTGKEYAKKLTVFLNWLAEKDVYIQRLLNENDQLRYKVELLRGKVHILMHKTAAQGRTTSNKYDNGTMELCMFSSCCFYYTSNLLNTQEPEKRKEIIIVSTVKLRKTGGNNTPLVSSASEVFCITGNAIDRQPQNGGNGIGVQRDLAYTLTATDRHSVYARQRVDSFRNDDIASTESARQHKDATDLVCQPCGGDSSIQLIRRLTPLECERLQGYPDGWTDIPTASDSARYKALGNSVAIPCVDCLLFGMACILRRNPKSSQAV